MPNRNRELSPPPLPFTCRATRTQLSQAEAAVASSVETLAQTQSELEAACAGREAAQQEAAALVAKAEAGAEAAAASVAETASLKEQLAQVTETDVK